MEPSNFPDQPAHQHATNSFFLVTISVFHCQVRASVPYGPLVLSCLSFIPHIQLSGVPGVKSERFNEGLQPQHCALSLVGEPIMYPEINRFVDLLHEKGISSFLVTNAQFPDAIR